MIFFAYTLSSFHPDRWYIQKKLSKKIKILKSFIKANFDII